MSADKKPTRQYFYKMDACVAKFAGDPDCICWYDEGTGPMADTPYAAAREWREKPNDEPKPQSECRHAGDVVPSPRKHTVICSHGHKTLRLGDVVVMVESPNFNNWLLREKDMTLHSLRGECDQYVHLEEQSP